MHGAQSKERGCGERAGHELTARGHVRNDAIDELEELTRDGLAHLDHRDSGVEPVTIVKDASSPSTTSGSSPDVPTDWRTGLNQGPLRRSSGPAQGGSAKASLPS